jgi:hypothetical protein
MARLRGVSATRSWGVGGIKERNGYDGRSAGKGTKVAFSRNIGCRKNRGIARDLLYAEPELGADHSHLSLSTALPTSISSCIRPRMLPGGQLERV